MVFGGPAAKMASRGLGALSPPPPDRLREGTEAKARILPRVSAPPVRPPPPASHVGMERVGEGESSHRPLARSLPRPVFPPLLRPSGAS